MSPACRLRGEFQKTTHVHAEHSFRARTVLNGSFWSIKEISQECFLLTRIHLTAPYLGCWKSPPRRSPHPCPGNGGVFQCRDTFQIGHMYALGTRKRSSLKWFLAGTGAPGVWWDLKVFYLPRRRATQNGESGVPWPQGAFLKLGLIKCWTPVYVPTKRNLCYDQNRLLWGGVDEEAARQKPPSCPGTGRLPEWGSRLQEGRNMRQGVNRPLEWNHSLKDEYFKKIPSVLLLLSETLCNYFVWPWRVRVGPCPWWADTAGTGPESSCVRSRSVFARMLGRQS